MFFGFGRGKGESEEMVRWLWLKRMRGEPLVGSVSLLAKGRQPCLGSRVEKMERHPEIGGAASVCRRKNSSRGEAAAFFVSGEKKLGF